MEFTQASNTTCVAGWCCCYEDCSLLEFAAVDEATLLLGPRGELFFMLVPGRSGDLLCATRLMVAEVVAAGRVDMDE